MDYRACGEKEQGFEKTVIDRVQQRAAKPQKAQDRLIETSAEQSHRQPQNDDADILHAVVGEQASYNFV